MIMSYTKPFSIIFMCCFYVPLLKEAFRSAVHASRNGRMPLNVSEYGKALENSTAGFPGASWGILDEVRDA